MIGIFSALLGVAASGMVFLASLLVVCLGIMVALCVAASKSRLHIPAYVALAFFAFAAAMLAGHFSGAADISGTATGLVLSVVFFLLMAVTVGSVLALFFYRHPYV